MGFPHASVVAERVSPPEHTDPVLHLLKISVSVSRFGNEGHWPSCPFLTRWERERFWSVLVVADLQWLYCQNLSYNDRCVPHIYLPLFTFTNQLNKPDLQFEPDCILFHKLPRGWIVARLCLVPCVLVLSSCFFLGKRLLGQAWGYLALIYSW